MPNENAADTAPSRCMSLPEVGQIDGRTRPALAFKAVVAELASDLGGADHLSRAQMELIRRAAGLSVLASQQEADILTGGSVDVEAYTGIANTQRRLLVTLGLKRKARDVTPDPLDYIKAPAEAAE
jgi:hypothetical protein